METSEERVKQVFPDARCVTFGWLTGLVHVVTNELSEERYKSKAVSMYSPRLAWDDALKRIEMSRKASPTTR